MVETLTLSGKLEDITARPVDATTSARIKRPAPDTAAGSIITTQPAPLPVSADGSFTATVHEGLGWLYIDGDGWSDSVRFVAAAGMTTFWEAVANAYPAPIIGTWLEMKKQFQVSIEELADSIIEKVKRANPEPRATGEALLSADTVLNDLLPGRYQVPTRDVAKALGLPAEAVGTITVDWSEGVGSRRFHTFTTGAAGDFQIFRNSYYNGRWLGWREEKLPWSRGALDGTVHLDDLRGAACEGVWGVSGAVASKVGSPTAASAVVEVTVSGSITFQSMIVGEKPPKRYLRWYWNGGWQDWHEPAAAVGTPSATATTTKATDAMVESLMATTDPTKTFQADHAARVASLRSRIGPVTLDGAGGLSLIFDHGTTAVRDWVWPELKKRGLTGTLALSPEVHLDGQGDSRDQATTEELKQMVAEGLVIASHSGDHLGAISYNDLWRQIVVSKQTLESKLGTRVDSWVQPGYALSAGNYKDFGAGRSEQAYSDTMAGRLLQQTYPVITGYVGEEYLYPPVELPVGVRRSAMEKKDSIQTVYNYVNEAAEKGLKHLTFIHPYIFTDDSDDFATRGDYIAFLDHVAKLRDAGRLKVLTLPQLAIAT